MCGALAVLAGIYDPFDFTKANEVKRVWRAKRDFVERIRFNAGLPKFGGCAARSPDFVAKVVKGLCKAHDFVLVFVAD